MEDTTKFDDGEIHRAFVNRVSFRNNSFSELKMNTNGRESFIVMHRRREGSNRVILRNEIPVRAPATDVHVTLAELRLHTLPRVETW